MTISEPIASFEALLVQLENEKIPLRKIESEPEVSEPARLGGQESILHIRWEATPDVIQFIRYCRWWCPRGKENPWRRSWEE